MNMVDTFRNIESNQSEGDSFMELEENSTSAIYEKIIRNHPELSILIEIERTEAGNRAFKNPNYSLERFYQLGFIHEEQINLISNRMMRIHELDFEFHYFPKEYITCKLYQRNFDICICIPYNLLDKVITFNPQAHRDEYRSIVNRWLTEFMISQNPEKILSKSAYNSYELLPIESLKYKSLDSKDLFIGQGGFGAIYRNQIIQNKFPLEQENSNTISINDFPQEDVKAQNEIEVVIKLSKKIPSRNDYLAFINEARFLISSNHENVIRYYGVVEYENMQGLVLEYCSGGSLKSYLKNNKEDMEQKLLFAIDAVCGLAFMHSKGICHLDIKPDNIFVCTNKRCKLGDFGLALGYLENNKTPHGFTMNYASPEVLQKDHYTDKSDIWSLGMTLYWLFLNKSPYNFIKAKKPTNQEKFKIGKEEIIYQIVFEGIRPQIDRSFEAKYPELANLMRSCWEIDPNNRPNAYDALLVLERTLEIKRIKKKISSLNLRK